MSSTALDSAFFKDIFGTDEMRHIFQEQNQLQKWLDVEAALARVEARLGIIPQEAADIIVHHCRAEEMSIEAIKKGMDVTRHPIVPVIRELQRHCPGDAGEYIHYGATTQDIMDSGVVLQLKEAFQVLLRDMGKLEEVLMALAERHRDTVMAGRTHGQQALPVTFGYKVAVWVAEVRRHIERLQQCRTRLLVGQFSGGAGSLASLGDRAWEVHHLLMEELGLGVPDITWHTSRDNIAELVAILGMIAGSLAKMGHEVVLLQKTEVAEVEELFGPGQVGSSTMPQKRNPARSEQLVALARVARGLVGIAMEGIQNEHERDSGSLHAEWHFIPEACITSAGAINISIEVMTNLRVRPENMIRNLYVSQGLVMSEAVMLGLARVMGRMSAHDVVYHAAMKAFEEGRSLKEVLLETQEVTEHMSESEIDRLLDPTNYLGIAPRFVDKVLEAGPRVREKETKDA
ncbi:MAG: adenylosuccinate lyase [Chloroflexi bacterium]|nr:adenylosuccinate lyase [Chloroflexota bacterium]